MTNAETARLAVQLDLTGNFQSALGTAESRLGAFSAVAGTKAAGALGTLERAAGKMGSALGHAGSQLKGLLTGPLGIIGLTGGLLSFGGAISSTLTKMNDLAFGTEKLRAITGGSAQTLSTLIAATEKYGITVDRLSVIAGFYEKTAGKLNETFAKGSSVSKLIDLQKQFHITLVDGRGKALAFDQALLNVADAYARSKDRAAAATLAATLFGRSWQTLAPILAQGKKGILDLEREAAAMGLQLSAANVADFAKYRKAIRDSQEAISGLEIAIGEDLLPEITRLADEVGKFVTSHKSDIVAFFHNAVAAGKQAVGVIGGLASAVGGFWNTIPPGVRDMLVKGFIADRTVKFLFGFDPAGAAIGAIKNALSTGLATGFGKSLATAGIGKLFVQPVFVTNPGFGGVGGAGGALGVAGGATGMGLLSALGIGAAIVATAVVIGTTIRDALGQTPYGTPGHQAGGVPFGPFQAFADRPYYGNGVKDAHLMGGGAAGSAAYARFQGELALAAAGVHNFTGTMEAAARQTPDWLKKWEQMAFHTTNARTRALLAAEASLVHGVHVGASAAFLGAHLGTGGIGAGGAQLARRVIAELQKELGSVTDPGARKTLIAAIDKITARLPRLEQNAKNLHLAESIAKSAETQKQKLSDLSKIMADVKAHGDKTTQTKLQKLIDTVKHQKPPMVNTTVRITNVTTGAARMTTTTMTSSRYSSKAS